MYLRSLELSGFKSFAKKSDLSFTTPITGIVGPNGSGKSNVAEAFRFVLGEQSIKSMRGKRGEDLIFNGSSALARGNRASVKITLDNTQKQFPVDFEEVTIERTVYRDGVNEYVLNGSRARLKDIQEILASANIGSTGHHIISQGEADRVLSASPKERREMIEDALGLKIFQYKKTESERRLIKTRENISQIESLRREVVPHLRFLERQVKKIEKSLEVQESLKSAYREYLKREDEYIAYHHDRITTARVAPEKEHTDLQRELIKAREILATSNKDAKSDALISLEEKVRHVREERSLLTRDLGRIEGQMVYLDRRIKERESRHDRDVHPPIPFERVKELVQRVETVAEDAGGEKDASKLMRLMSEMVRTLRSFLNDITRERVHTEDTKEEDELHQLIEEKKKIDATLKTLDHTEEKLQKEYKELKDSIDAELSESRAAEREVFRIMGREQELAKIIGDLEREQHDLERDRNEFKRELEEAVSLIGRAVTEYFSYVVIDSEGKAIDQKAIVAEAREVQLERRRSLEKMKIRLEELGAGMTDEVLKEYKEVKERDEFLARELADLEKSVTSIEALIVELATELNTRFGDGIDKIDAQFSIFFKLMFGGGNATLRRVKPKKEKKNTDDSLGDLLPEGLEEIETQKEDAADGGNIIGGGNIIEGGNIIGDNNVIADGIEIDVSLPNKRVRGLDMLSGGERALTSIALIFAMSQVNPPPFIILDETDAALDEANSKRYGDMIAALAEKSQLILITHNRETMSRAGVLYGVTMSGDGVSKLLSVKLEEAVEVAK